MGIRKSECKFITGYRPQLYDISMQEQQIHTVFKIGQHTTNG